jgi:alanyl-tRNA synthetase
MTDRLYYLDASCHQFDARVVGAFERDGRPAVVLDRTAFYPTSGGQPHDLGQLGGVAVLDVVDEEDVVHVLAAPLGAGARVSGEIDRRRRFDHMQQHTGQHVLSAAFDRLFDNSTLSFHMGAELCTIDLAREPVADEIDRAVEEANRVVFEDRAVSVRFASPDEADRLPLRKPPARGGRLRLIEVSDFDLSACGGTHVARTGAIGLIVVLGSERIRGGARVSFACGGRALAAFNLHRAAVTGVVRQLSVLPQELPAAVERMQADLRDLRKSAARLQEALGAHEAARLLAAAESESGVRIVSAALEGWDAGGLKAIASALTAQPGVVAVLVSLAPPHSVVIARSADMTIDAGQLLRELASALQGRGGGRPELAQGGGFAGPPEAILHRARALIARGLADPQRD